MTRGNIDSEALEDSLEDLRRGQVGLSFEDALRHVLDAACIVFDATGAGLMFINEDAVLRAVAATDEPGMKLEEAQERVGEGPCVDSLLHDTVVQTEDLAADERWPELRPECSAIGIRAVLGVPIHVAGEAVATLNVYLDEPYEWNDSEIRALQAYAALAGNVISAAVQVQHGSELTRQLQHALDNRVAIERAVGMLMGRDGIDAVTAFNQLRRSARDAGERVVDVASRLLAGEEPVALAD
jgi:GAF domain-containing protein